jgi:hygromycin-B 7''-O-kinase
MQAILNENDLIKYRNDLSFLSPIIRTVLEKENIFSYNIELFKDGSSIVIYIGNNCILKIFPLFLKHEFESELNGLILLNNHKIDFIPKIYSYGEIENYTYIILSKETGITLYSVWNNMDLNNKISIMNHVGKFLKSIHSIKVNHLLKAKIDWKIFLEKQINNCSIYHKNKGVPHIIISQIDEFISSHLNPQIDEKNICFLSADIHYWNILVKEYNGKFQISAFIDYGDSFYGEPEYDFLAPGCFMANDVDDRSKNHKHTPELLKSLFLSYGYTEKELNQELSYRLFTFHLIHKFSDISIFLKNIESNNLYELAENIWSFKN